MKREYLFSYKFPTVAAAKEYAAFLRASGAKGQLTVRCSGKHVSGVADVAAFGQGAIWGAAKALKGDLT